MFPVTNMIMIGGDSRNSGKTTLACELIRKLSVSHEVIGLKVTSVRPGETEMHGNHTEDETTGFTIFEELNTESNKDTSRMLRAGAAKVFYVRVSENYVEKAILQFMSKYINKQVIVCESRSLRRFILPGQFLMMKRESEESNTKNDIATFLSLADKVFCFDNDQTEMNQYVDNLIFENEAFYQDNKN